MDESTNLNNKSDLKLPICTDFEYMTNKSISYKHIIIGLSFSYYQDVHDNNDKEMDYIYDTHRYTYKNTLTKNKYDIEKTSGNKINSIYKGLNKISTISEGKLIEQCKVESIKNGMKKEEIVYKLYKGNKYVLLEPDLIKCLMTLSSNSIKTYLFLKWRLRCGRQSVTRREIAYNIGLSVDSRNNLTHITDVLKTLVSVQLIKKDNTIETSNNGNEFNSKINLELNTYEEWKEYWDSLSSG